MLDDDGKGDLGVIDWRETGEPAAPIVLDILVIFGGTCFACDSQAGFAEFAHADRFVWM